MARHEEKLNLFIGKTNDGEYIFLDDTFEYDDGMKGLTGKGFEFYTEFAKDEMDDDYLYGSDGEYLFCEYIKYTHDHNTDFEEWVEMCKDEHPNGVSFDDSCCGEEWLQEVMKEASEREGYDYEYSNCVRGGRIFDEELLNKDNYEYVNEENFNKLLELHKQFEE